MKGHYAKAKSGEIKEFTGISNLLKRQLMLFTSIDTSELSVMKSGNDVDDIFLIISDLMFILCDKILGKNILKPKENYLATIRLLV